METRAEKRAREQRQRKREEREKNTTLEEAHEYMTIDMWDFVERDELEDLRGLIEGGVTANWKSFFDGERIMAKAAAHGRLEVAQLLRAHGAQLVAADEEEPPGNAPSNALLRCVTMGCKDKDMLGCGGVPAGSTMAFLAWLRSCPPVDRAAAPPLRPLTGWDRLGLLFNRSTLRVWNRVKPADEDA
tara:strand:+ start:786 stop:1346 length:561 start_codon:yes stop_codon:yes gene_type:complete